MLLAGAARGIAEPAEPLTVTRLQDSESGLLVTIGPENVGKPDAADSFSRAISQAVRLQQQSIEAKCNSARPGTGAITVRWAWEASCRYKRY